MPDTEPGFDNKIPSLPAQAAHQSLAHHYFQEGRLARRDGNLTAAVASFRQAIALEPDFIPAYNNLANLLQAQGRSDEAAALYEQALALAPEKAVLHCNLASLRQIQGRTELALEGFREAIRQDATFFLAHCNLGKLLASQNKLEPAAAALQQALSLKPDAGEVHLELGHVFRQMDHFKQALACYKAAIRYMPESAEAYNCLGALLQQRGEIKVSLASIRRALKLNPDFSSAHFNIAMLLENLGELQEAQTHYERALVLEPEALNLHYHVHALRLKLADWVDYEERREAIVRRTQAHLQQERKVSLPLLSLLAFDLPDPLVAAITRHFARDIQRAAEVLQADLPDTVVETAPRRLRIGYVSPDFRDHAVGRLICELFQCHRRPDFEIFAYSLEPFVDEWTEIIRRGCDHYTDVSGDSPLSIARRIRADGIHILIDLAGYTANSRTALFALQPAPVQALFLGYPGTMGADFIQYILADRTLIPPEAAAHYSEQVVYLPHAWVATPMPVAELTMTRTDCGLPEEGAVFCCFNGIHKINPRVFGVWMRILQRVPGSVLWLAVKDEPIVKERLQREAAAQQVDPARLVFAGALPHAEYLARYRLADLFLDTFVYNAASTAVSALLAGLPMLTCPGTSNASRMGASVCDAAGMPELICNSAEEYEQRAVALGADAAQLLALKARLSQALKSAPLFQPRLFVRELEQALTAMWRSHTCGVKTLPHR